MCTAVNYQGGLHPNLLKTIQLWRRDRDSNPGYPFEYTRFPSVRLQPLGHLSDLWESIPQW